MAEEITRQEIREALTFAQGGVDLEPHDFYAVGWMRRRVEVSTSQGTYMVVYDVIPGREYEPASWVILDWFPY